MNRFRALLAIAAAAIAGCNNSSSTLPHGPLAQHKIQHVIVMLQENRSFNNIFAGFPGAETSLTGKCEITKWCKTGTAKLHSVTLETTDSLGLGIDIDHSHKGFQVECDANSSGVCQNDGFDKINFGEAGGAKPAKLYPYAYVERSETKQYWDFASKYALADHMFFTDTAASFIAHQEIIAGTVALSSTESLTDQPSDLIWGCDAYPGTTTPILKSNGKEVFNGPFPCFTQYKTMADILGPANVSWKYYVAPMFGTQADFSGDVWDGFDAIKSVRYGSDWKTHVSRSLENTNFFNDVKNGSLPSVSWLMPILADSDHPAAGCNHGPRWVTQVVDAVGQSKYWDSTAIVLLWDDWGGWYDPVPPAQINYTSLGFRVPMVVISPFAKPKYISKTQYDFGSVLKFIEQTFNLPSLGTSDASANSMTDIFDFNQAPTAFTTEAVPHPKSCLGAASPREIIEHDGGVPE